MKRCLNCMEVYEDKFTICPYCGYMEGTPPKVASHLIPGTIIDDRYIIGTVIDHGGFGIVYKAWDSRLGITIAIKEYYPSGLVNRVPGSKGVIVLGGEKRELYYAGMKRFLEEARTMARFEKIPNTVHVFGFLEENGTAYLIMEYLDGMPLNKYLKQFDDGIMQIDDAIMIVKEIGKALSAIHKEKVIHRDISPDNIFLCSDGRIKLLDFGAARLSSGEKSQTLSVILKPGYAPPEQYRKKSRQGPKTDIYALGATLYKMITGKLPVESLDRLVEDSLEKPGKLNPEVEEWLDTVILTAMAKNPEARFSTMDKFIEALNHQKTVSLPEKRIIRKRMLRSGIAILIILIAGITSLKYWNMYNDISGEGVPDGTIAIMLPVSDEEDKSRFNDFKEGFEEKFNGKKITLELVPEEEYGEILNEAVTGEEAPDIYMGNYLTEENEDCRKNLKGLVETLSDRQHVIFKNNCELLEEHNAIPLGFDLAVLYENTYLSREYKSYTEEGGAEIEKEEKNSMLFNKKYTGTETDLIKQVPYKDNARKQFLDEHLIYYVGMAGERNTVQKSLPGYSSVTSIYLDGNAQGVFFNGVSINKDSPKKEIKIAELFIKYALSDEGQDILCVQHQGMLPLNNNALERLKDVNESLSFIKPSEIEMKR